MEWHVQNPPDNQQSSTPYHATATHLRSGNGRHRRGNRCHGRSNRRHGCGDGGSNGRHRLGGGGRRGRHRLLGGGGGRRAVDRVVVVGRRVFAVVAGLADDREAEDSAPGNGVGFAAQVAAKKLVAFFGGWWDTIKGTGRKGGGREKRKGKGREGFS